MNSAEPLAERRMLIRRFDAEGHQVGQDLEVTGEPELIQHHLLHQNGVESLNVQYLGDADALG